MRISPEEFDSLSISDILVRLSKVDDLEMYLKGAYMSVDEKVEIVNNQLEFIEEQADKIVALEKLLYETEHQLEEARNYDPNHNY